MNIPKIADWAMFFLLIAILIVAAVVMCILLFVGAREGNMLNIALGFSLGYIIHKIFDHF